MSGGVVAAVDLGATSGRVLLGHVDADRIAVRTVTRFSNKPVPIGDGLHWSILELYRNALEGLAAAHRSEPAIASVGIDSWGCDYALTRGETMLSVPYSHRDPRTAAGVTAVHSAVPPEELFRRNGLQHLPYNTVFQLAAERQSGLLDVADRFRLIPDLLGYWLAGSDTAERTNASTTGLLGAASGEWDRELAARLGIDPGIFPSLVDPGTALGPLSASATTVIGRTSAQLTTVGSHDTASAVVAIPSPDPDIAYVSCGTWSLVGVELERPVLDEGARRAGFTNERGVDGRIRFLHNVMGLWLLTESVREWERSGERVDLPELIGQAAEITEPVPLFDADDRTFMAPGDMPSRIAASLDAAGRPVPSSRPAFVRCILASLADAYARTVRAAGEVSGRDIRAVHIVGGGSQNALLCQLTADATALPVLAGPVEATAIGNVVVQARALNWITGDLEALRALIARHFPVRRYEPQLTR
jgi:rhamnulokinase